MSRRHKNQEKENLSTKTTTAFIDRERFSFLVDLIRYSENSDLKDAKEISEEDAVSLFKKNFYSEEKAREFIESVKDNPFNDWCQWR